MTPQGKLYVDKHRNNHACDIAYDEISECAHIHFVNTGPSQKPSFEITHTHTHTHYYY